VLGVPERQHEMFLEVAQGVRSVEHFLLAREPIRSMPSGTVTILFTDTPFRWELDQSIVQEYAARLQTSVRRALPSEDAILISVFPVSHAGYIAAV